MSRKATYSIEAAPHAAPKLSPFDLGHAHGHFEQKDRSERQAQASSPKSSVQGMKNGANAESSGEDATSAGDDDAEESDGDSAEADEESSDADDPDAIAPPACVTDEDGHQAGPATSTKDSKTCLKRSKVGQQTNSPQDSSDDEVYAGIDLISDSERDGSDMDHLEERAIVDSEDHDDSYITRSATNDEPHVPQTSSHSYDDIWGGLDFDQLPPGDPSDFFDEQFGQTHLYNFLNDDDGDEFSGFPTDIDFTTDDPSKSPSLPSQRRVRFAEPPHSEIQGTVAIFRDANQETEFSSVAGLDGRSNDADSQSSSGYESDYGETTDEDDIPASARPEALIRRSSATTTKTSSATSTPVRKSGQPWGPKLGSWCIDPTKPLAIVDSCGKRLLVCPARRPKKPDRVFEHLTGSGSTTANTSPRLPSSNLANATNDSDLDQSDWSSQGLVSPMFGPPNPLDTVLAQSKFIPANAGYPEYNNSDLAVYGDVDYDEYDDEDDEYENAIKMEDLFNLTSEDDDSEAELTDSHPANSSSAADQSSGDLLGHLNTEVATAFRQTQRRVEPAQEEIFQPRSPLRKRKASPPLHAATRRRIMT
ncbi:MAG: hypothetical protein Q9195_002017 [Heterodermia aff. obscurata]